jgi:hypothetical protein
VGDLLGGGLDVAVDDRRGRAQPHLVRRGGELDPAGGRDVGAAGEQPPAVVVVVVVVEDAGRDAGTEPSPASRAAVRNSRGVVSARAAAWAPSAGRKA